MLTSNVSYEELSEDYYRIEQAVQFLEENYQNQPGLDELARYLNLSEFHLQRMFTRWVGISPKRFTQYLTKEFAKEMLQEGSGILETTYQSGLSSPGRLHDLFVNCEAATPGEFKSHGRGLTITYGYHSSPFGRCMLATTDRGIISLVFEQPESSVDPLLEIKERWAGGIFVEDSSVTESVLNRVFAPRTGNELPLTILVKGTNFQIKVWEALLRIPSGYIVSYQDVAVSIGLPSSARAVGRAVASNRIPVLIPCHRVIRQSGEFGGYRWGTARKRAILAKEFASREIRKPNGVG